jgi:hypothetical protein
MTSGFEFIINGLAVTGICLVLDAIIMAILNNNLSSKPTKQHNAERSHYALSILSVGIYIIAYQGDSETFRNIWMQVLLGLYLYDVCIIARDWHSLKSSYRVFYSVHHGISFGLFTLWYYTFIPFTDAMALGALLWVSSDVWRWIEQYWRLSGHESSSRLRDTVWYLERGHRLFAYGLYMWILDFSFNHTSEAILIVSGITMDIIDAYFQHKARVAYKLRLGVPLENNKLSTTESIRTKKAA